MYWAQWYMQHARLLGPEMLWELVFAWRFSWDAVPRVASSIPWKWEVLRDWVVWNAAKPAQINSVQTRCIVKGEAQKSLLFWRYSWGGVWFSQESLLSRNSIAKPFNWIQSLIFTNAPCKSTCHYNAGSLRPVEQSVSKLPRSRFSVPWIHATQSHPWQSHPSWFSTFSVSSRADRPHVPHFPFFRMNFAVSFPVFCSMPRVDLQAPYILWTEYEKK